MVLDLVTNPNRFFARRAEQPRWRGPVLVLLLVGLVGVASQIPVFQVIAASLPADVADLALVFQLIGAAFGLVFSFVIWIVSGVVLHIVATVAFGGEGDLWGLVKLSGWGFAPQVLSGIVSAIVAYTVFSGVTLPSDPQATAAFVARLQTSPEFLVATAVSVVVLLWSGLLWAFAAMHSHDLTFREGVLTAAVLVVLNLLLTGVGLVTGGGL